MFTESLFYKSKLSAVSVLHFLKHPGPLVSHRFQQQKSELKDKMQQIVIRIIFTIMVLYLLSHSEVNKMCSLTRVKEANKEKQGKLERDHHLSIEAFSSMPPLISAGNRGCTFYFDKVNKTLTPPIRVWKFARLLSNADKIPNQSLNIKVQTFHIIYLMSMQVQLYTFICFWFELKLMCKSRDKIW